LQPLPVIISAATRFQHQTPLVSIRRSPYSSSSASHRRGRAAAAQSRPLRDTNHSLFSFRSGAPRIFCMLPVQATSAGRRCSSYSQSRRCRWPSTVDSHPGRHMRLGGRTPAWPFYWSPLCFPVSSEAFGTCPRISTS
jgi:hypothetical protein